MLRVKEFAKDYEQELKDEQVNKWLDFVEPYIEVVDFKYNPGILIIFKVNERLIKDFYMADEKYNTIYGDE